MPPKTRIDWSAGGILKCEVITMAQERINFAVDKGVGLHDTTLLQRALDSLPGVMSASFDKQCDRISVAYDGAALTPSEIQKKIEILGYPIQSAH